MNTAVLDGKWSVSSCCKWAAVVLVSSRLLSSCCESNTHVSSSMQTRKGDYRYAWGINFPKELAPFDVHLIPVIMSKMKKLLL